jgi:hypothetical protein
MNEAKPASGCTGPSDCYAESVKILLAVQRFMNTCEPGDYTTSFVCHPSFDEDMFQTVRDKVDSFIKHNAQ